MPTAEYAQKVEDWTHTSQWLEDASFAAEYVASRPRSLVLDVGCNTGDMLDLLAGYGASPVGVEVNPAAIERLRLRYPDEKWPIYSTIKEASAAMVGGFDLVLMSHVICHMPHPGVAIRDAMKALRPGGRLLIITPNPVYDRLMWPYNLLTGYRSDPTILHEVGFSNILTELQQMGFDEAVKISRRYHGQKVVWLPTWLQPDCFRSRLRVSIIKDPAYD